MLIVFRAGPRQNWRRSTFGSHVFIVFWKLYSLAQPWNCAALPPSWYPELLILSTPTLLHPQREGFHLDREKYDVGGKEKRILSSNMYFQISQSSSFRGLWDESTKSPLSLQDSAPPKTGILSADISQITSSWYLYHQLGWELALLTPFRSASIPARGKDIWSVQYFAHAS